jgi:hypothetical protein
VNLGNELRSVGANSGQGLAPKLFMAPRTPAKHLFSPDELEWLEKAISEGMPIRRMAQALNRAPATIKKRIVDRPSLWLARLEYELQTWSEIAHSKDWRAKAWVLARLAPGDYNEIDAIKNALRELAKETGMNLDEVVAVVATAKAELDRREEGGGTGRT